MKRKVDLEWSCAISLNAHGNGSQTITEPSSPDVAFAYFSMSYEEMVYARECHAFLTDSILDSSRLGRKDCVVKLVHHLWVKSKITARTLNQLCQRFFSVFSTPSRLKQYPNVN